MSETDTDAAAKYAAGGFGFAALLGCILLAWAIGLTQGSTGEREQHAARYYEHAAEHRIAQSCRGLSAASAAECVAKEIKSAEEAKQAERALAATEKSAEWALIAVLISAASLLVTIIALYFVKGTLEATRDAVVKTAEGARAAAIAANAAVAQHRAWLKITEVTVSSVEYKEAVDRPGSFPYISAVVSVETANVGYTPAVEVRTGARIWLLDGFSIGFSEWAELWRRAVDGFMAEKEVDGQYGAVVFPDDKPFSHRHGVNTLTHPISGSLAVDPAYPYGFKIFGVAIVDYCISNGQRGMTYSPFIIHLPGNPILDWSYLTRFPAHGPSTITMTRLAAGDRAT